MELRDLLYGISPWSHHFKDSIRQYNAAFAFTSLGVKVDHRITNAPGPYCFRINDELHHFQEHSCLKVLKRKHMHRYTFMIQQSSWQSEEGTIQILILLS